MGSSITERSSLMLYAGSLCLALLAGVAVAAVPSQVSVVVVVLVAGVLFLALSWAALRPRGPVSWVEGTPARTEDALLRLPRRLYYVGAATIGFLTIRPALAFTASDWIFFASFGLTCLVLLTHGLDREYLIPRAITFGVILFAAGGLVSSSHALSQLQSVSIVLRLLSLTIIWFLLRTVVLQTRKHVEYA